ncbi:ferritin-like domain-containing protein [Sporosarcina ureilytica]|uniref:Rubrerythrin family protein n=1 Tax=Sporosarcina ureilytica TaxID=298596 RepID=A0A1D8JDT5_9BACL|nr:ferritin-like domain-containing protein [Sporosarcina ureilytica]AOV06872.1 rubrerythrin family protein [Sporosarcina ureilytica]
MFINQLKQSIEDEFKAFHYYKSMYKLTDDPLWKAFIEHVYEDEKSHYEMFQQLHYMLTGSFVQNPKKRLPCYVLKDGAKQALLDKLDSIETYKIMLLTVPIQQAYNPVFIAMHDEMEHATRFSTMYNAL